MTKLFGKLIHLLIMPCSHVPQLIEQERSGKLPLLQKVRLRAHLSICKWCAAYARKVEQIDKFLTKKYEGGEKKDRFESSEIQDFKDRIKKKMTP
ncbi:hypothetical protein PORCRE_1009 [Porphyromonas crevioricanis JCM 15906]|uniref:Zinc-finger domain-containing protein n=2 Tax=Porphyromonas crevioricanis TaxID=393921 RepID=A0A2X4PXM7_9PORP|nr:hypothetical protein [Porphyromonas crevioricanis]KGN94978.1 hypothetical protein HQ38_04050 [Porphyromonas crevioricanis]SJZ52156.1 hypothetical protein SAMN02745203_00003 [Porphyromonas crevioricanis]SQH73199.1 Uncharacterised protein [Porphyromonas crevioricanis]GAD05309.1 hypothetical protein PORCRE_1009 [Porphyromonas crevioricanis JCM 15906]GAD06614.1 hypothetical protein PORCAN_212 [Porphyromonas crevioricanis JCM 13913]